MTEWEKILTQHISHTGLVSRKYKELQLIIKILVKIKNGRKI